MLINCPACGTNFSIPDGALGAAGRKLKCAKCGHKWFQAPPPPEEDDTDLDLAGPSFGKPDFGPAKFNPVRDDSVFDMPPPSRPAAPPDDFDLDSPPVPTFADRLPPDEGMERPLDESLLDEPQPIPELFATGGDKGRKGTGFLWFLLVLLLLGGLGGGAYYFQDQVVEMVPETGELFRQAGLRREKPGAGLELRKAGTPERFVHNDTDVLVVRGIIANVTDRARTIPPMKLVLMDRAKQPVQEKLSQAPVAELAAQGTVSFKIMLERPDPNAVEVVVVFVDPAEVKGMPISAPPPPPAPAVAPVNPDVAPPPPAPVQAPAPAPAVNGDKPAEAK